MNTLVLEAKIILPAYLAELLRKLLFWQIYIINAVSRHQTPAYTLQLFKIKVLLWSIMK